MRFLGIDYGGKRVGLAISDDGGRIAFPKGIVPNDDKLVDYIYSLVDEEKIEEIVLGESMDYSGAPNKIEREVNIFLENIKNRLNIPINRQKEFFTSVEARKLGDMRGDVSSVDDSAAALILQRYLDKINNTNK
ncbi:MAG: Holliday junction resolvase RuvX [Candidatus Pacebacteria bacterium]|nr:Holliday junction resolvase RuvX [Candidatus Paceibacterota bacterium]MBP9839750.1 Holliday junction resolvase RuvX [Candidatus Paceibacterota bacterium]